MKRIKSYLSLFVIATIVLLSVSASCLANQKSNNSGSTHTSYVEIKPSRDLGKQAGEFVCFRLQSFDSISESEFTDPTCSVIENSEKLVLSWDKAADENISYRIYSGDGRVNIDNFLMEASESFNTLSNAPKKNNNNQSNKKAPKAKKSVRIQAENFDTFANFYVEKNVPASDQQKNIRLPNNTIGSAALTFNDAHGITAGSNDITLQFFDEADGKSRIKIMLNGIQVGKTIRLNKDGGGNAAESKNLRKYTIPRVNIQLGDTLTIFGYKHRGEAVRIDYVELKNN